MDTSFDTSAVFNLVWGHEIQEDVFERWNQGFIFSSEEPLALIQEKGGPCAVIAPVQAFIIWKYLFEEERDNIDSDEWRACNNVTSQNLLISVLSHILRQANPVGSSRVAVLNDKLFQQGGVAGVVTPTDTPQGHKEGSLKRKHTSSPSSDQACPISKRGITHGGPIDSTPLVKGTITLEMLSSALINVQKNLSKDNKDLSDDSASPVPIETTPPPPEVTIATNLPPCTGENQQPVDNGLIPSATDDVTATDITPSATEVTSLSHSFHSNIKVCTCIDEFDTMDCLSRNFTDFTGPFGLLLFLYSVVLTKGVDLVLEEKEESEEPLIDPIHGHGSQNLINLLLVGNAVTNVFDSDKDVDGIKLRGISGQSRIGFLTVLEALRYCEVGSFFKNPLHPIWLVGSETHLTVLFSLETGLTGAEEYVHFVKREFKRYDKTGGDMINSNDLGNVLEALELESDSDYVAYMISKLEIDKTGIILLKDFLAEFCPNTVEIDRPKAFAVYHYNGLYHSTGKVQFSRGNAILLDEVGSTNSDVTLLNCLHTKWPGLVIHWENHVEPKII